MQEFKFLYKGYYEEIPNGLIIKANKKEVLDILETLLKSLEIDQTKVEKLIASITQKTK